MTGTIVGRIITTAFFMVAMAVKDSEVIAFSRWSIVALEECYLCLVPSFYNCNYLREQEYNSENHDIFNGCDQSLENQ